MVDPELLAQHQQELRRGSLVLASLLALRIPNYGYALLQSLEGAGVATDANTLYPLLRRLEGKGLLTSDWDTSESRPRKFYRTSNTGADLAQELLASMHQMTDSLHNLAESMKPQDGEPR